jgi:hypothetical protein
VVIPCLQHLRIVLQRFQGVGELSERIERRLADLTGRRAFCESVKSIERGQVKNSFDQVVAQFDDAMSFATSLMRLDCAGGSEEFLEQILVNPYRRHWLPPPCRRQWRLAVL